MTSRSSEIERYGSEIGTLIRKARREGFSVQVTDWNEEDEDFMLWIVDMEFSLDRPGEEFVTFVPKGDDHD